MKVKPLIYMLTVIILVLVILISRQQNPTSIQHAFAKQPFQIGPISTDIYYTDSQSMISLEKWSKEKHKLTLHVTSSTNDTVLERHDLSLVFANGRLANMLSDHNSDSHKSSSQIPIRGEGSIRYDVISFHHAATKHRSADIQASQVHMSSDQVYLLSSNFSSPTMFREAQTNTQRHWKRILDQGIQQDIQYQWNHMLKHFEVDTNEYTLFTLMNLEMLIEENLANKLVVGKVWEAIFQFYMVGEFEDKRIDPINSTMPLILISKAGSYFIILYRTADGEEMLIKVQLTI